MSHQEVSQTKTTGSFASRLLNKALSERAKSGKTTGELSTAELTPAAAAQYAPPAEEKETATAGTKS